MFKTALSFDMRSPDFGAPHSQLYESALEMIEYADKVGVDEVIFSEHHASEDGYIPAPELMATAAAACTERIAIMIGAIVLPLHDPVRVAEMIAVADLVAKGRLHVALVAGYVEHEFRAFGKSLRDRSRAMDEGLDIIVRALSGERFTVGDREIFVRPLPFNRKPHLYVGGGVPATAIRAARHGLGLWPMKPEIVPIYEAECRKLGREPGPITGMAQGVLVAEDPERTWDQVGPHVLHLIRSYASWASDTSNSPFVGIDSREAARAAGVISVVTPEECVEIAQTRSIAMVPLVAGLRPEIGWESLELFAEKVLPRINAEKPSL